MIKAIELDQKIELIFTSPSVERKVQQFYTKHPESIRYLRMPLLLDLRLSRWSKALGLIMCRYDFFPELLLLPTQKKVLAWASLKGKSPSFWLKAVYKSFDLVIASTVEQTAALKNFTSQMPGIEVATYDFRPLQIRHRLKQSQIPQKLIELINSQDKEDQIIVGSAWENDFHLFDQLLKDPMNVHLWLAPHQLSTTSLEQIKAYWKKHFPHIEVVSLNLKHLDSWPLEKLLQKKEQTTIWLLESPGILVELYSLFNYVYVGGGFGRSIHSVLEPAVAGCKVCCGPKIHRSTEIDLVNELSPGQVSVVNTASEFSTWWNSAHQTSKPLEDDKAFKAMENWIKKSDEIIGLTLAH
ncbi:MAG: hypothetical protein COW01_02800 [Bdellovibrionales bacterium CG12_big_fil_rev_8_21_14_0_65_38_15]|nr:MAG: hypothetical protein COW79_08465 [Bdellovibrionales bacterium CG22_combo_CG10-13_8_21_14_all_38_13]PIQ57022.1 MAG: hypothetical protein COW01_02800 [Bdellovibrionales bacterium CG12_big_fil_rev_8_21_14_0_65_38_15]PIR29017.1 MAG: hypothetical protein COV38_12320 [Bdellovibrionales bacterium CG11_big_fil_rev_8_21_14_0_20_38_13]